MGETRKAVTKWLEYEHPSKPGGQDADLLALAMEDTVPEVPEQPEALTVLRRAGNLGIPVFNGSWHDWPYIAMLELEVAANVEHEFAEIERINIANRLKAAIGNENS